MAGKGSDPLEPSPWEWATGIVGGMLLAAALAYLAWIGIATEKTPPRIDVIPLSVEQQGDDRWLVTFRAMNAGRTTAAAVTIRGRLVDDGAVVEEAATTIDYLPARSQREGGLFFRTEVPDRQLELGAVGYQKP